MENQLSAKYAFDGVDKSGTSIFASYSNLVKRFSESKKISQNIIENVNGG